MRRTISLLLLTSVSSFAWDVGFDFRATQGFVTDPIYAAFVTTGTTVYPTTQTINGQHITFGWETQSSSLLSRDRGTGFDPRLAGINCQVNEGDTSVFRVDLPSTGSYMIGLALGDGVGNNSQNNHVAIQSTGTTVLALNSDTGNGFSDAAANQWQATSWPGSNVMVQRTFGTTILRMALGGAVDANLSCVAHLRITFVPAAPSAAGVPQPFFVQ